MSTLDPTHPASRPSSALTPASAGAAGIVIGLLSIVLGVLVLAWPGATLLVVAIVFGIELVVMGVIRTALAWTTPAESGALRWVGIVLGVLTVVAGIICFLRPGVSLFVLAIFLAAGWIADGIAALVVASRAPGAGNKTWLVVSGIVTILGGLVVAIFPGSSLVLLAQLGGVVLIVIGVVQVIAWFLGRRAHAATA